MQRCKNCGEKMVRFPLKDSNGKWIWINLFKADLYSIILMFLIIFMVIGYKADMQKCNEAIEKPCDFCETTNCCQVNLLEIGEGNVFSSSGINIEDIPELNKTK